MRLLFLRTAAVSLLMLGSAAAQVGGVTGGIGTGSTFGGTGLPSVFGGTTSSAPVGGTGIPMGATELGTSGLSPVPVAPGLSTTAPVSPLAPPLVTGAVPGLAGTTPAGTTITGFGIGGMQPLPGSPGTGLLGNR
jgi:hypothetical protein